ncbi:P-loop containing nucleoside triphosphate hydrolase [Pseudocohnilembus persalinus]|uniref:p-loop containing nucleoside triphosphate hydrolase n=1 Tax=Pseudocohnilembus persalinus TaxID=266149 RepID=A0A0V0QZT8_PSEPJ|nr:P-loop containing nucleoside triphosphate hydrolase [Pseudocohnilembus persalinus]|eukprot:KRX07413.1 P-loop containing nucleoside triphosphate hydrolase [Pseudocohnilembus persalinus]
MDKTQKLQYQRDVEQYLEQQQVYTIFEDLMKQLIIKRPENPIDFLISELQQEPSKKIFIVGPPNSKVRELSLQLANHLKYTCVSVGDLLKREMSKKTNLGWQIEKSLQKFQYVTDDIVIQIVEQRIKELQAEHKNYILEGFPKTRVQGLTLQKMGIIPDSFIIYNVNEDQIQKDVLRKIENNEDGNYDNIPQAQQKQSAENYALEYNLNIKQVKEIYHNNYFAIDGDKENIESQMEDMAKLVKFKIDNKQARRAQKIVVTGPPGSGRTTLAKQLAQKYEFVYISTRELIADQIQKNTEVGKLALEKFREGELVPQDIINGLVNARIQQVDCDLQGYVLDGYPKSADQLECLRDSLKITPTLIVVLECPDTTCLQRISSQQIDPVTGIIYDRNNIPSDISIKQRLTKPPNQNVQQLQNRNKAYKDLLKKLEMNQDYTPVIFKTDAGDNVTPQNILENVSIKLEKALANF